MSDEFPDKVYVVMGRCCSGDPWSARYFSDDFKKAQEMEDTLRKGGLTQQVRLITYKKVFSPPPIEND